MQNLIPIQITLQAANASDARQLVLDLAGTIATIPPEQIPPRTDVSTVQPPAQAPMQATAQPPVQAPMHSPAQPAYAQAPTEQAPAGYTAVPTAPAAYPSQPASAPAQPPATVPTTAPTYTLDQLAVAATGLMDAGKDILPLLGKFGVQALTQLPKDQYGNFATELRGLGAQI